MTERMMAYALLLACPFIAEEGAQKKKGEDQSKP
jgi:hypothetical protein